MIEDVGKFVLRAVGEDGNGYAAKVDGREVSDHPVGHVLGENGNAVSVLDPEAGHAQGELLHLAAEFLIGVFLSAVYKLVSDVLCVVGSCIVKDLVQGSARVLAIAILAQGLVRALSHITGVFVRLSFREWQTFPCACLQDPWRDSGRRCAPYRPWRLR